MSGRAPLRTEKDRDGYRSSQQPDPSLSARSVHEDTLRWTSRWGLGGMAVVLVILLLGTGGPFKVRVPAIPEKAYESILSFKTRSLSAA